MDTSAGLTAAETAVVSDPDRSCEDANRQLGHAGAAHREMMLGVFDESLRLKNTLDAVETRGR